VEVRARLPANLFKESDMSQLPSAAGGEDAAAQAQRRLWACGDFSMVATTTIMVGELLCESAGVSAGRRVLDIATGSGNTALAAARRWCDVVGIDFVPALLERARERAAAERLAIDFQAGDIENIPFADASFDVVLSTFGVAFAPDQERGASELLRVCRPGGTIGLAHWTPDGFIGEVHRVSDRYYAPSAQSASPVLWGTESGVRDLLGGGVSSLVAERRSVLMRFRSVAHWLEFTRTYLGPVRMLLESLDPEQRRAVGCEVAEVAHRFNRASDGTMAVPADYLEVIAVRR
jgi:SAM-dependent methyltransferase